MKKPFSNILRFLLFFGTGFALLYLVFRRQNAAYLKECALRNIAAEQCSLLDKLLADFGEVRWGWMALVFLCILVTKISRTIKWRMLLRSLGYQPRFVNGLLCVFLDYFANLGLPRSGDVVRATVLSRYEKLPFDKVFGTVVMDRGIDVLCLLLAFGLALVFEFEKLAGYIGQHAGGSRWKWLAGAAAVAGLIIILKKQLAQTAFYKKASQKMQGFGEGLRSVGKVEKPRWFIFHSLNIWICYFLMTWFGLQAFPPTAHLGFAAGLMVFNFATLGMIVPTPGGMGAFHFLVIACLTSFYGIREGDAFSVANILYFSISIVFNVLLGLAALALLPWLNRRTEDLRI